MWAVIIKEQSYYSGSLRAESFDASELQYAHISVDIFGRFLFSKFKKQSSAFHSRPSQNDKYIFELKFSAGNCCLETELIRVIKPKQWTLKCCRPDCLYLCVSGAGQVAYSEINIVLLLKSAAWKHHLEPWDWIWAEKHNQWIWKMLKLFTELWW